MHELVLRAERRRVGGRESKGSYCTELGGNEFVWVRWMRNSGLEVKACRCSI